MTLARPGLLLWSLLLAGCVAAPAEVALPYAPAVAPAPVARPAPLVALGTVEDARDDEWVGTARFGTIRGDFGNPVRRLDATVPVRDVVASAARDGLAARGLLAGEGRGGHELRVRVRDFNAAKLRRTQARVALEATLVRRADGRVTWRGEGIANPVAPDRGADGAIADPAEVAATARAALAAAVDAVLDDPGFRAALR